ncbi:MAG: uroporphyrinogen decarboxylase [Verrucomicrobia bacterium]|nr:uroporphyrinogen decarboxylase [Verrucomicrobiota bacterium]
MNDLLLKALRCEEVPRPPVWIMRQAGRYMPEYRALRQRHTLWELFHDPDLAAEVTLLPIDLLGVDAAILFSDILVITEALGLRVDFPETGGAKVVPEPGPLKIYDVKEKLHYVYETIRLVKPRIDVPLIGFCGGPFTVASYCAGISDPTLLRKLTDLCIAHLKEQVAAGADVVQVFDSWANRLSDADFKSYCQTYLKEIVDAMEVPVILFCRDSSLRAEILAELCPAAISCDWGAPMSELRKRVPSSIAVQGNIDPEHMKGSKEAVIKEVDALLTSMQAARGFIVNLGHGVLPDTPFENVRAFVETVHHFAKGGIEQRIASGLPPDAKPNFVPRS